MQEEEKGNVQFIASRNEPTKALETPKQARHFVAAFIQGAIVCPRFSAMPLGWPNWRHIKIKHPLPGFIIFTGARHDAVVRELARIHQQLAAVGRSWARWQPEIHGCTGIHGNPVNCGGPAASGVLDGLFAVFYRARAIGVHWNNGTVQRHGPDAS